MGKRSLAKLWSWFCWSVSFAAGGLAQAQSSNAVWEWHETTGAVCRDGSPAGYYMRRNPFDDRLVIYLEGGGACFNNLTCGQNPASATQSPGKEGIFADRDDNPVRGWNMVYVPYCTGDIFGGSRRNVTVSGVSGSQQFMGYKNMQLFVEKIREALPDTSQVLLTGVSAGGFGAIFNYSWIQEAYGPTPVVLLDDSGVPLEDAYLRPCLQKTFRTLWGLNEALPKECVTCRNPDGGGLLELANYIRDRYGSSQQGAVLATQDSVLRTFFGFSQNDCRVLIPGMQPALYEQAITSLKKNYLQESIKTFIIPTTTHTFISSNRLYETQEGGQNLASWVEDLIEQQAEDRGP